MWSSRWEQNQELNFMRKLNVFAIALVVLASGGVMTALGTDTDWKGQLEQWRVQHAEGLRAPDGWLTLVGLAWWKPGDNIFGTAADSSIRLQSSGNAHFGVLRIEPNGIQLKAPAGGFPAELHVDGQSAKEQSVVVDGANPTKFSAGTLTFFVIRRGDQLALRIKDSEAPTRTGFHGLRWYAPDPVYRIDADWVPFAEPKERTILNVVGIATKGLVPGVARFTLHGQTIELEPVVQNLNTKNLMFVIRDATSGKTTYADARFLHTGLPDHGLTSPGKLVLDFNRLENPPCAYTPYATCPLPPERNRLKGGIAAGELIY